MISSNNEKSAEWMQQRSLRRFPENSSTIISNNNNSTKSDKTHYHSWSNRDNEQSDRKIQNLLSSSLMNSSSIRTSESDSPTNNVFSKEKLSDSPLKTPYDDTSCSQQFNYITSQTKGTSKMPKPNVIKEPELKTPIIQEKTVTVVDSEQAKELFLKSVLENGEYLIKHESWHQFRGPEEIRKCSKKVIIRNENIWEMVRNEYIYLRLLVNIKEVYWKNYPYVDAGSIQSTHNRSSSTPRSDSVESNRSNSISEPKERSNNLFESPEMLIPGLDQIIECHAKLVNCLINNHVIRPDKVITEIGRVLHESFPEEAVPIFTDLYGQINYAKQYIGQKLSIFKKYPVFLSYIHKCERDPRCDKKTLPDILLHLSIHFSKIGTVINAIIDNTINDSYEVNNLIKFKEKLDKMVIGATSLMDYQSNSRMLQSFVDNYEITPEVEESELVFKYMTAPNAKLIFNGKVLFELKKNSNGKFMSREVLGVALEECIFFLQIINEPGKVYPKYQLFKERDSAFPALLEWGKLYGYFREADTKSIEASSFYVIIEKPGPSIKRLVVSTPAELNSWKKCMMQGFTRWQSESSDIKEADNQLNEQLKKIEKKWANTQFGIELIKNLDDSLKVQLEYRTVGFRCILEEELKRLTQGSSPVKRNSSNSIETVTENDSKKDDLDSNNPVSTETFLPDLTTRDGIHDWLEVFMEWVFRIYRLYVNRLKFSLCSSGANITRSASEIEARKRPSIPIVKKCDTFSSRDSPTYEKRQTDVTFLNPPITKHKKDQRRISVSGFTNLFRMNSKAIKSDENGKGNDPTNITDTILEGDQDTMTLSNLEMISETDCFLSSLSKDTVAAFNEINNAAKNITIELLGLRTQNMILQAEIKKIQEENQSFRDFLLKYQKSIGENQSSFVFGNCAHQKTDSINHSVANVGLNSTGSTDLIADSFESFNENSTGYVHTTQKMVECRRQTENLRQMYAEFEKEKKKWEKDYESQRSKLEVDQENVFFKNLELEKEKEILVEREKKYKDNCLNLQKKIDMYFESYGINLEDEQFQQQVEGAVVPNAKLQQILQMQPHFRSHSDDISHKRNPRPPTVVSGPVSPPLASTEATSYHSEQSGNSNSDPIHNPNIPDQLRGSLINQEHQSMKTISSDNILETRNKTSSGNVPKPKMTPSIDRKEMYSSSNMCFTNDDKEERDCSSDVDDLYGHGSANARSSTFDVLQSRKAINSTMSKTLSISDNSTKSMMARNSVVTNSSSGAISNVSASKPPSLGIPLALAEKSKMKKEKFRKFKII